MKNMYCELRNYLFGISDEQFQTDLADFITANNGITQRALAFISKTRQEMVEIRRNYGIKG